MFNGAKRLITQNQAEKHSKAQMQNWFAEKKNFAFAAVTKNKTIDLKMVLDVSALFNMGSGQARAILCLSRDFS